MCHIQWAQQCFSMVKLFCTFIIICWVPTEAMGKFIMIIIWLIATEHHVLEKVHCHDNYPTNRRKHFLGRSTCLTLFWLLRNEGDDSETLLAYPNGKSAMFPNTALFPDLHQWVPLKYSLIRSLSHWLSFLLPIVCHLFMRLGRYCWAPSLSDILEGQITM